MTQETGLTVARKLADSDRRPVLELRAVHGWQTIDFRELWQYRELMLVFMWRDIKIRYRQTLLGILWVIGQPLISMILFTLIFNRVAKIEAPGRLPYPAFALVGLVPWLFFANGVTTSGNSLIGNVHLISKIYFPRLLVPASAVLSGAVDFVITFVLLGMTMVWYGIVPTASLTLLPLVSLLVLALAMGTGFWLSALNVEYRDVRVLIPFILQIGMYVTPVVYPRELLPQVIGDLVVFNPMTGIVETIRASIFGTTFPWETFGISIGMTLLILVSGAYFFSRIEKSFADLL